MSNLQTRTLAPITALRPVAPNIDCPDCEGFGMVIAGQCWSDGMLMDERCTLCAGRGVVANPDFDASAPRWTCSCATDPSVLEAGDSCRRCDAEVPELVS